MSHSTLAVMHALFRNFLLPAILSILLTAGCDRSQEPKLVPARGTMNYRGRPIPGAEIVFHPDFEGQGWMPVATVAQDGTFAAGTKLPGDGVLPGKYKLTVVWRPNVNDDGEGHNLLPARYSNPNTSNLVVEVGRESDDLPPFRLLD